MHTEDEEKGRINCVCVRVRVRERNSYVEKQFLKCVLTNKILYNKR